MIKIYSFLIVFILLLIPTQVTLAQETASTSNKLNATVEMEQVNPSNEFSYGIKRLKEKVLLILYSFSNHKKADFYKSLLNSRLSELKYTIDNKDMANFELSTKRYYTIAGEYTEFIILNNMDSKKADLKSIFASHIPVLESLRDQFGDPNKAEWRFIQDDINYIKQYSERL